MINLVIAFLLMPLAPFWFYGDIAGSMGADKAIANNSCQEDICRLSQEKNWDGYETKNFEKYNIFPVNSVAASGLIPTRKANVSDLKIWATSSVAIDVDTGTIIHYDDGRKRTQIESLTKMMTAVLVMENVKDLNEEVVLTSEDLNVVGTVVGCPTSVFCNSNRMYVGEKVDRQFDAYGIPKGERLGRFTEALEAMKQLWQRDTVSFRGKYFSFDTHASGERADAATVVPRPVQQPYPRILVAANGDAAIRRAAAIADGWLFSTRSTYSVIARQVEMFREAAAAVGRQPTIWAGRDAYCAKDWKTAIETVRPALEPFYADRARYAFQTQIFFLLSRYHQQRRGVTQVVNAGKNLISDYTFAKDSLFARINLKGDELEIYHRVHEALAEKIPLPDLLVYLRANTDGVEHRRELRLVVGAHAHDPACAVRVPVDQLGLAAEVGIAGHDLAADRAENVRRSLHRLDDRGGFARVHVTARLRRLDEHEVAQGLSRVVGDADGDRAVSIEARPLVGLEEAEIGGYVAHDGILGEFCRVD